MRKLILAVASEPVLDDYREALIEQLGLKLYTQIIDMNVSSIWHTKVELVANCINMILNGQADFVVLASRTGNGLQVLANKNEHIRAAPIPRKEYVEEAAALDPNMCDVDSTFNDPQAASDLVVELLNTCKSLGR